MIFRSKKIMTAMRAVAVFSILSISIFSYSYQVVLAHDESSSVDNSSQHIGKDDDSIKEDSHESSSNDGDDKIELGDHSEDNNKDVQHDDHDKGDHESEGKDHSDDSHEEDHQGDDHNVYIPHDHSNLTLLGTCFVNDYSTDEAVYGKEGATFSSNGNCTPPVGTELNHVSIVMDDGGKVYVNGEKIYKIDNSCGIKYQDIDIPMNVGVSNSVNWTAVNCGLAGVGARVEFKFYGHTTEENCPPVLTLIGSANISITAGDVYVDQGASAQDKEDGDITSSIVKTGSVDVNVPGVYTITYNVKDSKGLSATPVSRTVTVLEKTVPKKGKITFCLMLANSQNEIATTSINLPQGLFSVSLATSSSDFSTTTIQTRVWNTSDFAPNAKKILNVNDSDCITYNNLDYGTYLYSPLSINGSTWNSAFYNDQNDQSINNVFDFFPFSTTNSNSDGVINIDENRSERVLVMYDTYKDAPACLLPEITSPLSAQVTANNAFSFPLNASSTSAVNWDVATTSLPIGLTFATTTNTISGTPTIIGTYNIAIKATNLCGFDQKILVIEVKDNTGGGGGNSHSANLSVTKTSNKATASVGDAVTYTISIENKGPDDATNVKVTDIFPGQLDFVSASTSVGNYATSTGIWTIGNLLNGSSTVLVLVANVKVGTEGQKISNTVNAVSDLADSDSSNNTSVSDVVVNGVVVVPPPSGGGGGGGGGGVGANGPIAGSYGGGGGSVVPVSTPIAVVTGGGVVTSGCSYLQDYLRVDFNNNPVEVRKLQTFLRDFEGFANLSVTGVYDQATIDAVNVFQMRYKDDVLTPWGHTAPTSYVYILTKKKVNEIYCRLMFPVTPAQQNEIDSHRNALLNSTNNEVSSGPVGSNSLNNNTSSGTTSQGVVGKVGDSVENMANVGMTTLAGLSSTTKNIASDFTANVISSGKKLGSLLSAFFTWPFRHFASKAQGTNTCDIKSNIYGWSNILLILVIIVISYLWYREYKGNRKIEEINKEIDLQ